MLKRLFSALADAFQPIPSKQVISSKDLRVLATAMEGAGMTLVSNSIRNAADEIDRLERQNALLCSAFGCF